MYIQHDWEYNTMYIKHDVNVLKHKRQNWLDLLKL